MSIKIDKYVQLVSRVGAVDGEISVPAPIPPPVDEFCSLLEVVSTAGALGLSDVNVIVNGRNYAMTSTDTIENGQAIYQSLRLYGANGAKFAYEMQINNASALDYTITHAFGFGIFGGTFGFNIVPADLINGLLLNAQDGSELINPWANEVPLIFQVQVDGVAGSITLIGSDGTVQWVFNDPLIAQVVQAPLYYFFGGQSPVGIGETMDFTINMGEEEFHHPLPNGFKTWCELDQFNASYIVFPFFPSGGTQGVDPIDGRTIFLENDGVKDSQFTGSMGYAALTVPVPYDWNVYEHEIIQLDASTLDDYWRMGYVGFISTQGGHVYQDNDSYVLETYYSLGNLTATQCFNNIPLSVGDVMALVIKNRRASEGQLLVRPYYDIAGETCLFDPIPVPPSGNGEDYVPNCQMENSGNTPIGNTARVRFNGQSGDYASTYVDTFKDIQGDPIAGALPEVRESWFENRTVYTPGGSLPVISNSNTTLTVVNSSGSNMSAITHSRTLANLDDGMIIAAINLGTLVANNGYKFYFEGLNTDSSSSQFGIEFNGGNLVMVSNNAGVIETPQDIQVGHTVTAGDEWGIQYDPDNSRARGILVRGVSTFVSGWISVDTLFDGTVYMPRVDTSIIADTETCVINCEYKVANMSAEMRTAANGSEDLEGNAA